MKNFLVNLFYANILTPYELSYFGYKFVKRVELLLYVVFNMNDNKKKTVPVSSFAYLKDYFDTRCWEIHDSWVT